MRGVSVILTMTFAGLTSRWMAPLRWAKSIAPAVCRSRLIASATGSPEPPGWRSISSARLIPAMNSVTKYIDPPTWPQE